MKSKLFLLTMLFIFLVSCTKEEEYIDYSGDEELLEIILYKNTPRIDKNTDGRISKSEAKEVTILNVSGCRINYVWRDLSCEYPSLIELNMSNVYFGPLEYGYPTFCLNQAYNLRRLDCSNIRSMNVCIGGGQLNINAPVLEYLDCSNNSLKVLDISCFPNLKTLKCDNNKDLKTLYVSINQKQSDIVKAVKSSYPQIKVEIK